MTEELGTVIVKDFNLPQIVLDLIGEDGEKTWTWADQSFFGLGGYEADPGPAWFAASVEIMDMFTLYMPTINHLTGESTGSMTLDIDGNFSVGSHRSHRHLHVRLRRHRAQLVGRQA